MKITFNNIENLDVISHRVDKAVVSSQNIPSKSANAIYSRDEGSMFFSQTEKGEKNKSVKQLQAEAANMDVTVLQDYRTLMSNTMSSEDYARMEEEGFDFGSMNSGDVVTIIDKIKAELAKSGKEIIGYTDDIDMDTLAKALGSQGAAAGVAREFANNDISVTKENFDEVCKAWEMLGGIGDISEDTYRFMVDNEMEPRIKDFYLAKNSGTHRDAAGAPAAVKTIYYQQNIQGYYGIKPGEQNYRISDDDIEKLLVSDEVDCSPENMDSARKLIEWGVDVSAENIDRLQRLEAVQFPVSEDVFAKAAAVAISQGEKPENANLTTIENKYDKAVGLEKEVSLKLEQLTDITARRQLEEVRFKMTAEVNLKLIESNFSIDTSSIEEFIEALKEAERQVASKYFPEDEQAVEKYELLNEAKNVFDTMPKLPAATVGLFATENTDADVNNFYSRGVELKAFYEKANESYENLMTAPRRDLGDNISRAFSNISDILKDLGLEESDTNSRAVRILGYNSMEINVENIQAVKDYDYQVRSLVEKMTPAATLRMIRDGVNPLEKSFAELNEYFDSQEKPAAETMESYSRFLYSLEKNNEITQAERESYIGIYRMLHQIENFDSRVVGTVLNENAMLQFSTLLSAVRSNKAKNMDISIGENVEAKIKVMKQGVNITEQIDKAFASRGKKALEDIVETDEIRKEYREERLHEYKELTLMSEEAVKELDDLGISQNADNLLAFLKMLENDFNPYNKIKNKRQKFNLESDDLEGRIKSVFENLEDKNRFISEYSEMIEAMNKASQEISISTSESIDIREIKLSNIQMSISSKMSEREEYFIPVEMGEEYAMVHLSFERRGKERGNIDITVNLGEDCARAYIQAQNNTITGYFTGNSDECVNNLRRAVDIFNVSVNEKTHQEWKVADMPVIRTSEAANSSIQTRSSVNREVQEAAADSTDNTELYRIAKVFIQAMKK